MRKVKQTIGQVSFDFEVDTQVRTTSGQVVTQTTLFNLPAIEEVSSEFTTTDKEKFIQVVESDNKEIMTLVSGQVTTTITKKIHTNSYLIVSKKGSDSIINELDSFTFKRNFYYYI